MNKREIFQHYSNILDTMLKESLFFDTYFQLPCSINNIEGSIDDAAIPENISIKFGISRGCIIDENYDWVVKFDIESDALYESLSKREVEISQLAREKHLEKYFAEAIYIGTYHQTINFYQVNEIEHYIDWVDYDPDTFDKDFLAHEEDFGPILPITISIPLYAYPHATNYTYTTLDEQEYMSRARQIVSPLRKRNIQIAMEFIYKYGMEEYEKLTDFLLENNVNDIHPGNVMDINGNFCIIDYGGYHSGYDEDDEEDTDW